MSDVTGLQTPLQDVHREMQFNEKAIFDCLLKPSDSYNEDGLYWADLSIAERVKFVGKCDSKEAARELGNIGQMFKTDALEPVRHYFRNFVMPGAGLGLEGYVLFSIGNLKPLFQQGFPDCWKSEIICSPAWIAAVEYLGICGIMAGQILVGVLGDWIGRRWGLIQDASIMFIGLLMLTAAWGLSLNGWVICYAWAFFIYGVGLGGEFPMTATTGMENAVESGKIPSKNDRLHRGRNVTGAFLMQGWGQLFNQGILALLLLIFHHGSGDPPYSELAVQWTYRVSFALPAIGTLWLVYFRTYKMRNASTQLAIAKKRSGVTGYDTKSLKLIFHCFGGRLVATAGGWFFNDAVFFGNKLFQSEFISVLKPDSKSIMPGWEYNLINVSVSLCGYYLANLLIDSKLYGRKWMQAIGFLMDFILFVIPGFNFERYRSLAHIKQFQAMYFLSSFFTQFAPT